MKKLDTFKIQTRCHELEMTPSDVVREMKARADYTIKPSKTWFLKVLNGSTPSPGINYVSLLAEALSCEIEDLMA